MEIIYCINNNISKTTRKKASDIKYKKLTLVSYANNV
jgi:hypothetical protein